MWWSTTTRSKGSFFLQGTAHQRRAPPRETCVVRGSIPQLRVASSTIRQLVALSSTIKTRSPVESL